MPKVTQQTHTWQSWGLPPGTGLSSCWEEVGKGSQSQAWLCWFRVLPSRAVFQLTGSLGNFWGSLGGRRRSPSPASHLPGACGCGCWWSLGPRPAAGQWFSDCRAQQPDSRAAPLGGENVPEQLGVITRSLLLTGGETPLWSGLPCCCPLLSHQQPGGGGPGKRGVWGEPWGPWSGLTWPFLPLNLFAPPGVSTSGLGGCPGLQRQLCGFTQPYDLSGPLFTLLTGRKAGLCQSDSGMR